MSARTAALSLLLAASLAPPALGAGSGPSEHALDLRELPQRPKPLLELGDRFLGRGAISKGVLLPTGATWQPSFLAWGRLRTAVQAERRGGATISEWANGLDLNGQLSLTPTERLVVSFRPWRERRRLPAGSHWTSSPKAGRARR